jgi:hypothetical protein
MSIMPELIRRRDPAARDECWLIFYDGVRVGMIAKRTGNPTNTDAWAWSCGFYPGGGPGEDRHGTATTFHLARDAFEQAWRDYLPKRTSQDFQAWRDHDAHTARKYALWDAGKKLEPPNYGPGRPASRFRKCPCGEVFDMQDLPAVQIHLPHITAAIEGKGRLT